LRLRQGSGHALQRLGANARRVLRFEQARPLERLRGLSAERQKEVAILGRERAGRGERECHRPHHLSTH
jgi:hypothetical protein